MWKNQGKSPDYRFTLANERTFLAWIRTALAFMVAAIGVDQLALNFTSTTIRGLLVILLGITSAGLSFYAYLRWKKNEMAMRNDADLPFPKGLIWLSAGLSLSALVIIVILVAL